MGIQPQEKDIEEVKNPVSNYIHDGGIQDLGNGIWKVFYRNVFLGFFNQNNIRDKQVSIRLSQNMM